MFMLWNRIHLFPHLAEMIYEDVFTVLLLASRLSPEQHLASGLGQ